MRHLRTENNPEVLFLLCDENTFGLSVIGGRIGATRCRPLLFLPP